MKYNKNADTFLFLLLFTTGQHEKNIEKTLIVSAGAQTRWKAAGSGSTLPQYLPNPKSKVPAKLIFTKSIFVLLSTDKKAIFKITKFKNLYQETTKGTLRPKFNFIPNPIYNYHILNSKFNLTKLSTHLYSNLKYGIALFQIGRCSNMWKHFADLNESILER